MHLVKAIESDRALIGNNRGGTNGRPSKASTLGIAHHLGGRGLQLGPFPEGTQSGEIADAIAVGALLVI